MTREEAIQVISNIIHDDISVYGHKDKPRNIALAMAIEALKKVQRLEYLINTHKQTGHSPHYTVTMEDLSYLLDMKEG